MKASFLFNILGCNWIYSHVKKSKVPYSNLMVWNDGTLDVTCDLAFFAKIALIVGHTCWRNYKQLLNEVFVISRIMEVEEEVISRRRRLRLITLTEILIILGITKSELNNGFIIHWTEKIILKSCFRFFINGKQHKARELDMITLRNNALRSYMTLLPVTLSVLDMIIV